MRKSSTLGKLTGRLAFRRALGWVLLLVLLGLLVVGRAMAQPTVLNSNFVSGTSTNYLLTDLGTFRQYRGQALATVATGVRHWQFATGTTAVPVYTTNWRAYGSSPVTLAGYNQAIAPANGVFPATTATATVNTGSGGLADGSRLPAIPCCRFYTFNITENAATDNTMAVLETTFSPASIDAVTAVPQGGGLLITASSSSNFGGVEYLYVRYSTDNFATSAVAPLGTAIANANSNTRRGIVPLGPVGSTVKYYVFSSPNVYTATGVTQVTAANADMLTLNLNNNGGSNYSYTTPLNVLFFESFEGMGNWNTATATAPNLNTPGFGAWSTASSNANANNLWQRNDYTTGWTNPAGGTTYFDNFYGQTGHMARFHSNQAPAGSSGDLVTPTLNFSAVTGNKVLNFSLSNGSTSGNNKLDVYLSTDNGLTYGPSLGTFAGTYTNFTTLSVPLGTTTSAQVKIKLTATSDQGSFDIGVDNFAVVNPVPLCGSAYTINSGTATAGTNFQTFADAFNYLSTNGLCGTGDVTITVSAGQTFTQAPLALGVGGTGATNRLIFRKASGAATTLRGTGGTGTADAVLTLNGVDWTVWDGLSFADNGTTTENGLYFNAVSGNGLGGCQNNVVRNGSVTLVATNFNLTQGIFAYSEATTAAGANSNNTFENLAVSSCRVGYQLRGSTDANGRDQNNRITGTTALPAALSSRVTGLGGSGFNAGVAFSGQQGIEVSNTLIGNHSANNSYSGVSINGGGTALISGCLFDNITGTIGVLYGVYANGASAGTTVSNCTFSNISSNDFNAAISGVRLAFSGGVTCTGNTFSNLQATTATGFPAVKGISCTSDNGTAVVISGNRISGLVATSSSTSSVVMGVEVNNGSGTPNNAPVTIANNMIADLRANNCTGSGRSILGLVLGGGSALSVYNNTVYLSGAYATATAPVSAALWLDQTLAVGVPLDYRNNLLVNRSTAGTSGRAVAIFRQSNARCVIQASTNNNLLYGTTGLHYDDNTAINTTTLAAYRTLLGNNGINKLTECFAVTEANTPFVSAADAHLNTAVATQAEGGGQRLTGGSQSALAIATDVDGQPRAGETGYAGTANLPDIGADETAVTPADNTPPVIAYTPFRNTGFLTNRTLTVSINDVSGIAGGANAPRLYYRLSTAPSYTVANASSTAVNAQGNGSYTFTLAYAAAGITPTLGQTIQYYVAARDNFGTPNAATNPAGGSGTTPPGTTAPAAPGSYNLINALAGDYYISASTGTPDDTRRYPTLTAAAAAYNTNGMTAAVRFWLFDNGTYAGETYPINLTSNPDASATRTLTIQPFAGRTVSMSGGAATPALLRLVDADFVTLNGSNVAGGTARSWTLANPSNPGTAAVLWLQSMGSTFPNNGCQNASIQNLNISGNAAAVAASSFGIFAGGTTLSETTGTGGGTADGADHDNLTILNNTFASLGVAVLARGTAQLSDGGLDNLVISQNSIGTATGGTTALRTGFSVSNALNYSITQNVVQNVVSSGMLTAISLGETGGTANAVTRNRLVGLAPLRTAYDGSGATDSGAKGIVANTANTSSNLLIANNMIQVSATSGGTSLDNGNVGILLGNRYFPTYTGGVKLYNNSVFVSGDYRRNNQSDVSAALGVGFYFFSSAGVEVLNNVFTNYSSNSGTAATGTQNWSVFTQVSNTVFAASNNNVYDSGFGASLNFATRSALSTYQTATGKDQQSKYGPTTGGVPPYWAAADDLRLRNYSTAGLESGGQALPGTVDTDFDGETRQGSPGYAGTGTQPDIGADEAETVAALPAFVLNGLYTINNTLPTDHTPTGTGSRNFRSFGDAIAALNAASITGNVTFNVSAGQTFVESAPGITANAGTTTAVAAFSVTFQKSGGGANPVLQPAGTVGAGSAAFFFDAGLYILGGGDNFTFDGIDINSPSGEMEYGYLVRGTSGPNGTANLTVKNASVSLGRRATDSFVQTYGVLVVQNFGIANTNQPTSTNGQHTNIRLLNLNVTNCINGIYVRGGGTFPIQNVEIANCTVGSLAAPIGGTIATATGVFASLVNKLTVSYNTIQYVNTASPTSDRALGLDVNNLSGSGADLGQVYNNAISNISSTSVTNTGGVIGCFLQGNGTYRLDFDHNTIRDVRQGNTTSAFALATGLRFQSGGNPSAFTANMYANIISGISTAYAATVSGSRAATGVFLDNTTVTAGVINFWHNTVVLNPGGTPAYSNVCLESASPANGVLNVRNNIFANLTGAQASVAKHYGIVVPSATIIGPTGSVFNYNNFWLASAANGFVGLGAATDRVTLANWQTNGEGANSTNLNPTFDATFKPTNASLSGLGQQITAGTSSPAMSTDYAFAARSNPPDMGAFEFPNTYNIALSTGAVTSPLPAYCGPGAALTPITLTVSNPGATGLVLGPNFRLVVTGTLTLPGGATQALSYANTSGVLTAGGSLAVSAGTANLGAGGTYTLSGLTVSLQAADGSVYPETSLTDNVLAGSTSTTVTTSVTWTGAAGSGSVTDWFNPLNWTSGCVPTATIDVLIPSAASLPVIASGAALAQSLTISGTGSLALSGGTLALSGHLVTASAASLLATGGTVSFVGNAALNIGTATFFNLALSGSTAKALTGPVNVANNLDLSAGLLEQGNFDLTMAAGTGTVLGASAARFVVQNGSGKLVFNGIGSGGRASAFFPIGTSASSYTPATVANTGTLDNFSARVTTGVTNVPPATAGSRYLNKQWDISEAVTGGSNATLTLQWNAADELPGFVRSTASIGHYVGTGWQRTPPAAATGSGPYQRTAGGYTSFSPFTVQDGSSPLPVELLAFTAQRRNAVVALAWRTASERNSAHFAIERSLNGQQFEPIAQVAAQGSKATPTNYAYLDEQLTTSPAHHLTYYRLRLMDADGTASYSPVRAVAGAFELGSALRTAPQPFQSTLMLTVLAQQANPTAPLTVCDATGRVRLRLALALAKGSNTSELKELGSLPPGLYLLQLLVDGQVLYAKALKD